MLKYKDETIGIGKVDLSDYAKSTDNHDYLKGKNVFTTTGAIMGKCLMGDGSLAENDEYCVVDYIEIPSGATHITYSGTEAHYPVMCFYDSSKTTIVGVDVSPDGTGTFNIPSGTSYFRPTAKISDFDTLQIEFNSVATSYEPHIKSNVELTEAFKVVTTTYPTTGSVTTEVDLPSGYTKDNCMILSATVYVGNSLYDPYQTIAFGVGNFEDNLPTRQLVYMQGEKLMITVIGTIPEIYSGATVKVLLYKIA